MRPRLISARLYSRQLRIRYRKTEDGLGMPYRSGWRDIGELRNKAVYSKKRLTPSRLVAGVPAGRTRVACPPAQWVTLRHHHEPYVAWEEFWLNQERIEANRTRPTGTPRSGAAFLSSLLSCGHCGYAMVVKYGRRGRRGHARGFYHCPLREYEGRRDCHNISATT